MSNYLLTLNFKFMKNLLLVFAFVFGIQTTIYSQNKINTDDLIGYWQPDEESTQLFFWKDCDGKLQIQEICGSTGEPINLISLDIINDTIIVKTIFIPNNWVTESKYTFKDQNTLVCEITGPINTIVTYTKTK